MRHPTGPSLRGKRAVVLGLGLSNLPVIKYLLAAGAEVTAADRKTAAELGPKYHEVAAFPVKLVLGPDYLAALEGQDLAFLTPGMRRDLPELTEAGAAGTVFGSEMTLFFAACRAPIIGITGSAGKTTTTTLVGLMLQASRERVWVGGNIGRPLLGEVDQIRPDDLVVVELSSFQLQDLTTSPHISAVLNVSPNHLDIHPTMEHYVNAKRNIYKHQAPRDFAVFGYDNETTRQMAAEYDREVRRRRAGHAPVVFSRTRELGEGAFQSGDGLWLRLGGIDSAMPDGLICTREQVTLVGEHNLDNILAAAAVAGLTGASSAAITHVATTFAGVEHRLELVRTLDGVRYYNDSKATTPESTIAALRALPGPVVLILGGYDKHVGFGGLAREALVGGKVRDIVLMGATAGMLDAALDEAVSELRSEGVAFIEPSRLRVDGGFAGAVWAAHRAARPGDTVLLSPACASFDMFANFEERGAVYKRLVAELPALSPEA